MWMLYPSRVLLLCRLGLRFRVCRQKLYEKQNLLGQGLNKRDVLSSWFSWRVPADA